MVYRRTRRRRMTRRTRRTFNRTSYRRFKQKRIRNKKKNYLYTRFCDYGEIATDGLNPYFGTYNFSLGDLPTYTEFTSLYDQYKINAVKLTFIPRQTMSNSTATAFNGDNTARFFSAIDYDDGTPPTSVDALREYQTARWSRLLRTHKRFIYKPRIVDTSNYIISPWMSTSAPNANYFGLKVAIEPTGVAFTFGVEAKLYLSFKNVK